MGTCYNSTIVNADCETVWATLRDFHQLEWAAGVVEKVVVVGDAKGHEPGARRVLNDAFHETLLTIDDKARNLTYSIDDGPGPVAQGAVEIPHQHVASGAHGASLAALRWPHGRIRVPCRRWTPWAAT